MLWSKLGLLGLCAMALSLMAFATSSAQAAEWLILNIQDEVKTGAELNASLESEIESKKDGTLLTKILSLSVGILCFSAALEKAKLVGGGKVSSNFKVTFTGCEVLEEPTGKPLSGCTVKSIGEEAKKIATRELKGQLQANGEVLIESNTSIAEGSKTVGLLAELKFEGTECDLKALGTTPVKGVLWIKDNGGQAGAESHKVKHSIEESKAKWRNNKKSELKLGTLWLGADTEEHLETSIDGSALVLLTGEHMNFSWGAALP